MRAQLAGKWLALLAAGFFGLFSQVHAHKASDAYFVLSDAGAEAIAPGALRMQLSLALKDVDAALDSLDVDNDRQLTWGEIRRATPGIVRWVSSEMQLTCAGQVVGLAWVFETLEQRSDGAYIRLGAPLACPSAASLSLDYRLFKDIDPTHRLLLSGTLGGKPFATVLAPLGRPVIELRQGVTASPGDGKLPSDQAARQLPQSGFDTLVQFFDEGVHHILTGYDHLAFLLALLLPVVLFRSVQQKAAESTGQVRRAGVSTLLLTVTGFTLGHSVTLALATLGGISASPTWVEPAIALTIAASAALNLYPVRWIRGDVLALVFGLIHGLAFSSVMTEAGVSGSLLLWGLAGFNLGVETGQLVAVALWCVLHRILLPWRFYQAVVVRGGSWALLVLALYWTVQRIAA
ncbi:MAG: HupE/UreJ family protein [Polaromonas sp.]